jgi:hypothetical protein
MLRADTHGHVTPITIGVHGTDRRLLGRAPSRAELIEPWGAAVDGAGGRERLATRRTPWQRSTVSYVAPDMTQPCRASGDEAPGFGCSVDREPDRPEGMV